MKKSYLLIILLAVLSCSKDMRENPEKGFDRVFSLLVVNEGKNVEGQSMGSVSRYMPFQNDYASGIYGGAENLGMGESTGFAVKWMDTLYVVSKENGLGSALSAYNNKNGAFLKGYNVEEGVKGSSFAVINNKMGVLTTYGGGALIIDLTNFTKKGVLKGTSANTGDLYVKNNFLYLIDSEKGLLAYSLNELETVDPTNLGVASGGFAPDRDGNLWAYHNKSTIDKVSEKTTLLKINPTNGVTQLDILIPILPALFSYRPGLLTSCPSNNTLFFIKTSETKLQMENRIIYKYNIDGGRIENFYSFERDSRAVNIIYNPSNNTLSAITHEKLPNAQITTFDATNAKVRSKFSCPTQNPTTQIPVYLVLN